MSHRNTSVQSNEVAEPILLQPVVEPDQSSMDHQLSMINQTNCVQGHRNIDLSGKAKNFLRGAKS